MQKITIHPDIAINTTVSLFILFIYNQCYLPIVCDLTNTALTVQDNYLIFNQQDKKQQVYIIVKIGEKTTKQQQLCIQKLIGICDKIICVSINQQIQAKIQKMYVSFVPQLYARFGENKYWMPHPSLTFINQSYRKSYARDAEGINYFRSVSEMLASKLLMETIKITLPLFANINNNQENYQYPLMSVGEFISIYQNTGLKAKEAGQIKYSVLGYKQAVWIGNQKDKIQNIIFSEQVDDIGKKIVKQIKKGNLNKKDKKKVQWKYGRIGRFWLLVEEEKKNQGLVREYKKLSICSLEPQIIVSEIRQFYNIWLRNTLRQLKNLFKNIANRRDSKAVSCFRTRCSKTIQMICTCKSSCQNIDNCLLLQQMYRQIKQFIQIHQMVIQDQYLSIFKYVPYQVKYLYRNQTKIYRKIGVFGLILVLAWLQSNVIIGITMVLIGCIFSAINI